MTATVDTQLYLESIDDDALATYSAEGYTAALKHAFDTGLQDGTSKLIDPVVRNSQPLAADLLTAYTRGMRIGRARA